jgi:hypothetical protein
VPLYIYIQFNCTQVCATSTKVIACEREIRVSANRGVDTASTLLLTTNVGVEPFSSLASSLFLFVSEPDEQLYEEEIMHQPATTNFTLDAHALLFIHIHSVCRRDMKKTDTNRFHASDHHHRYYYYYYYYCPFSLNNADTILFFRLDSEREFFLFSFLLLISLRVTHSSLSFSSLPSFSSVLIHQLHMHSNNIEKMLNCVYNSH